MLNIEFHKYARAGEATRKEIHLVTSRGLRATFPDTWSGQWQVCKWLWTNRGALDVTPPLNVANRTLVHTTICGNG